MSTSTPMPTFAGLARKSWQILLGLGIAAVVLGVLVLVWPGQSASVIAVLFGLFLLVSGIGEFVVGLSAPLMPGGYRFLNILSGIISFILGAMCFRSELGGVALLGVWIGIGWIMSGFSRLFTFGTMPDIPGRGWMIVGSIVMVVAGVFAITYPVTSVFSLALLGGSWLIVVGIAEIFHAIQWRRAVSTS